MLKPNGQMPWEELVPKPWKKQTFENNSDEFKMANFDGTPRPRPLT